jgi:hypothetical protein
MVINDPRGVPWTVSSQSSADKLFDAIMRYFTFREDTLEGVDDALKEDAACPMAWVLRGYLLLFARQAALVPDARAAYDHAVALQASATSRERLHIAALKAWIDGQTLKAQDIWSAILLDASHDLLALRVQHFNALFLGRPNHLADLATRTLQDWDADIPGAGFALSTACMGLEEVGQFAKAERVGRIGAELEPEDLWAVHSVAHVMEGEGRIEDGLSWMERPQSFWAGRGSMKHHLLWHEALFIYEMGAYDRALDYYDTRLVCEKPPGYLELSNAASLLMRLETAGLSCGQRWDELAEQSKGLIDSRGLTFGDVHILMTFGMAGDGESLSYLTQSISRYVTAKDTYDSEAASKISVPLTRAFDAHQKRDYGRAVQTLLDARADFIAMGGSNAQRDVLGIFLIDCALNANRPNLARVLIEDYLMIRPHSVPMRERLERLDAAP